MTVGGAGERRATSTEDRSRAAETAPRYRRLRYIGPAATLLVIAASFIVVAVTYNRSQEPRPAGDPSTRGAAAIAGGLEAEEVLTGPAVPIAPGRYEPSRELWLDLLPQLQTALEAQPGDVNLKRKLAIAYYNLGMLGEAAELYEALLAIEEDPVLRNRLGNTLRDMGETAAAEVHYRAAIAADPQLAAAYLNLAELLWRQGRDEEALAVIDEGLKNVPEDRRAPLEAGKAEIGRWGG